MPRAYGVPRSTASAISAHGLGAGLRLARHRGALQRLAAVRDDDRRPEDPLLLDPLFRARRRSRMLLTHGWPGSVAEFLEVIDPLRRAGCARRGGRRCVRSGRAFPPRLRLVRTDRCQRLGPSARRFGVARADASPRLPALCGAGRRLRLDGVGPACPAGARRDDRAAPAALVRRGDGPVEPHEEADLKDVVDFVKNGSSYQVIQGGCHSARLRRQRLPAGLAAWILDKFDRWTRQQWRRRPRRSATTALLDNIMVYWVTGNLQLVDPGCTRNPGCGATSARPRREGAGSPPVLHPSSPRRCSAIPPQLGRAGVQSRALTSGCRAAATSRRWKRRTSSSPTSASSSAASRDECSPCDAGRRAAHRLRGQTSIGKALAVLEAFERAGRA